MTQVNAQSGTHDNPYGVYTQGHQNWNCQAEETRKRALLDQDLARMRQEEQRQEAACQRQAQQVAKDQGKLQSASKVLPKEHSQSAPWSTVWALVGMISGAATVYPRVSGMDEQWWAIGFTVVLLGVLAGRFYKVIVFCITLAVVLAVGAIVVIVWSNWGQGESLSLVPSFGSSTADYVIVQPHE